MDWTVDGPSVKRARGASASPLRPEAAAFGPYAAPLAANPLLTMAAHVLASHWAQALSQGQGGAAGPSGQAAVPPSMQGLALPPPPPAEEVAALAQRYSMMRQPVQQRVQLLQPAGPPGGATGGQLAFPFLLPNCAPLLLAPPLLHAPSVDARAPMAVFPRERKQDQRAAPALQPRGVHTAPFAPPPQAHRSARVGAATREGGGPK